jgi:hypothetical protein
MASWGDVRRGLIVHELEVEPDVLLALTEEVLLMGSGLEGDEGGGLSGFEHSFAVASGRLFSSFSFVSFSFVSFTFVSFAFVISICLSRLCWTWRRRSSDRGSASERPPGCENGVKKKNRKMTKDTYVYA